MRAGAKVLQSGFYWPTFLKMVLNLLKLVMNANELHVIIVAKI
jgi:hypothetical protein